MKKKEIIEKGTREDTDGDQVAEGEALEEEADSEESHGHRHDHKSRREGLIIERQGRLLRAERGAKRERLKATQRRQWRCNGGELVGNLTTEEGGVLEEGSVVAPKVHKENTYKRKFNISIVLIAEPRIYNQHDNYRRRGPSATNE